MKSFLSKWFFYLSRNKVEIFVNCTCWDQLALRNGVSIAEINEFYFNLSIHIFLSILMIVNYFLTLLRMCLTLITFYNYLISLQQTCHLYSIQVLLILCDKNTSLPRYLLLNFLRYRSWNCVVGVVETCEAAATTATFGLTLIHIGVMQAKQLHLYFSGIFQLLIPLQSLGNFIS